MTEEPIEKPIEEAAPVVAKDTAEIAKQKAGKFFKVLKEKAASLEKNLDIDSIKERAKDVDFVALAEQIKGKATVLAVGKTIENVPTRVKMDKAAADEAFSKARSETLSDTAEAYLSDILAENETVLHKMRCTSKEDSSQLALSDKNLYFFKKTENSSMTIHIVPIRKVDSVQLLPPLGSVAGVLAINDDAKTSVSLKTSDSYFKSAVICRKITKLQ